MTVNYCRDENDVVENRYCTLHFLFFKNNKRRQMLGQIDVWDNVLIMLVDCRHETPVLAHPIKLIHVDEELVVLDKPCSLPVSIRFTYIHGYATEDTKAGLSLPLLYCDVPIIFVPLKRRSNNFVIFALSSCEPLLLTV